jgi:predicted phosphodiesterase
MSKIKRYVVSTVVVDANLNDKFIKSLELYCQKNKAELILLPTNVNKLSEEQELDQRILKSNRHLNRNLLISLLPINPEQIDPITGLDRLSDNHKSVIYASPKQRLKSIASPSQRLPRVLMTPGAVTHPNISNSKRSIISNKDHVAGAIIIEVETKSLYHYRQVQAEKDGSFIDLGNKYSNNKITKAKLEALIPGDYHAGFTDPAVKAVIIKVLDKYKPKHLILHDFFDGISVNHHIEHKLIQKARMGKLMQLEGELKFASKELKELKDKCSNVLIVKSNHDEFLDQYLDAGKYVFDIPNHIIGLELAFAKARGKDPLEYGLKKYNNLDGVTFLKSDESFKLTNKNIECGAHGHRGANGSRGSTNNLEKCYQNIVYGHSHSPEILRGAWVMGTSSYLKLSYNIGPSSWMQTMCFIYENGARQLINVIDGSSIV